MGGRLNRNLRRMCLNLVPFPRLHFLLLSIAPIIPKEIGNDREYRCSVYEMFYQTWGINGFEGNLLSDIKLEDGKFLSVSQTFRGMVATDEVDEMMYYIPQ